MFTPIEQFFLHSAPPKYPHYCRIIAVVPEWGAEKEYDDNLVDLNTEKGDFFFTSVYIFWLCHLHIERGCFSGAQKMVDKLAQIAFTYEHYFPKSGKYVTNTTLFAKLRRFRDALAEADEGILFSTKTGFVLNVLFLYALKARMQILIGDFEGAEESLKYANRIKSEIDVIPIFLGNYLLSQFIFDLEILEESKKSNNNSEFVRNFEKALKWWNESINE